MKIDYTGAYILVMSIITGFVIEAGAGIAVAIISMSSVLIDRVKK